MTHEPLAQSWRRRLHEQNLRGARIALSIVAVLYPTFGILDWLTAPPEWLWFLWGSRIGVTAYTILMFAVIRTEYFERRPEIVTATYMFITAMGICAMIAIMGGLASQYYAGIGLVMIGSGLLYTWPPRVVLITHGAMMSGWLLPNLLTGAIGDPMTAVSNLLFLGSTAVIVAAGQIFAYRSSHEQHVTQRTLAETKHGLETAHEQLMQLDRFKSQFFANITHELKTPLAMILTPIELMEAGEVGPLSEAQRATLNAMLRNGTKLLKLINDLLDLSRLEESQLRLSVEDHDVVAWLQNLVANVEPLAKRKDVAMTLVCEAEEATVCCDIERIERAVINLLSNATKFTPEGGSIEVRLVDEGDRVRVSVQDSGPGLDPEQARRVFERFYQTEMGSRRRHGGAGIGLALARELVELHGGRIWAESQPDRGALFHLVLRKDRDHFDPDILVPESGRVGAVSGGDLDDLIGDKLAVPMVSDHRLLDIAEATERRVIERDTDENRRPHTVLIVEDNADVVRVVHMAMRRQFKVLAAPDGRRGFDLAVTHQPNLIITDLMMPEVDGLELTAMLREDPRTSQTPIVMLTAHGTVDDRIAGLETGVNAYLQKPFSARELLTTARRLLETQEDQARMMLDQRMDSLETVAGGLAHEINNPLNYIKNGLEVVRNDMGRLQAAVLGEQALDERKLQRIAARSEKMFESVEAGVRRIAAAVELMRRYSREGFARVDRPLDVWAAVHDAAALLSAAIHGEGRLVLDLEGEAWTTAVPEEFNQVISNLVQNALEAVADQPDGKVEVSGQVADGAVELVVQDNGPGLQVDDPQRIFTPFFTTKGPGRGMGMGLTITWRVVRAMGGDIQVSSEPGQGTRFVVRVPELDATARAEAVANGMAAARAQG